MGSVGTYILSILAAGILVCICCSFSDKKSAVGTLMRMIGGIYLAFVMLSPAVQWDFDSVAAFAHTFASAGDSVAREGAQMASEAQRDIIQQRLSAYILDKATELQTELTVEITLDDGDVPVPESVRLRGTPTPYAKGQLQRFIEEELGIPKEHQIWIG